MAANKVFIVEDDTVIAKAVAAHLTTWQMQVQCAGNFEKITEEVEEFDMYPKFWTHIYKLSGHHGCFSVFYRRHPFCFCLNPFVIIVINILTYSNCKFFK